MKSPQSAQPQIVLPATSRSAASVNGGAIASGMPLVSVRPDDVLNLQRLVGNAAVTAWLSGGVAPPPAVQRGKTPHPDSVKAQPTAEELRSAHRSRSQERGRQRHATRIETLRDDPELRFTVEDQNHRLFVKREGRAATLMIASLPLPVAVFITELRARFDTLRQKAEGSLKPLMKPRWDDQRLTNTEAKFVVGQNSAVAAVTQADTVFFNAAPADQRLAAEEEVARRLAVVIKGVNDLAKKVGRHLHKPSNRPNRPQGHHKGPGQKYANVTSTAHYVLKMGNAVERYKIEGLLARYGEQPGYPESGFERDHQPHNALIKRVADMPEFADRTIIDVTAGHSRGAWSIMLQAVRHQAGRTFGHKANPIIADLASEEQAERLRLATGLHTAAQTAALAVAQAAAVVGGSAPLPGLANATQQAVLAANQAEADAATAMITPDEPETTAARDAIKRAKGLLARAVAAAANNVAAAGAITTAVPSMDAARTEAKDFDDEIRDFGVQYLIDSMQEDVAAMKAVVRDGTNYADVDAALPLNVPLNANPNAALRQQIQTQVEAGEDRINSSDALVRAFADPR